MDNKCVLWQANSTYMGILLSLFWQRKWQTLSNKEARTSHSMSCYCHRNFVKHMCMFMRPRQLSQCSVSYRMDNWGITSLFVSSTSLLIFQLLRPASGSNQLPIQWVLWILSTGHSADHSLSYALMKFTDKLTFTRTMCQCSSVYWTVSVHTVTQHMPIEKATWYFDVNAVDHFTCLSHSQRMMAHWCSHMSQYYILA